MEPGTEEVSLSVVIRTSGCDEKTADGVLRQCSWATTRQTIPLNNLSWKRLDGSSRTFSRARPEQVYEVVRVARPKMKKQDSTMLAAPEEEAAGLRTVPFQGRGHDIRDLRVG